METAESAGEIALQARGTEEVEIEAVVSVGIDGGSERFEDGAEPLGVLGVAIMAGWHHDGGRADRQGPLDGHSASDAEDSGFVAGGNDRVAADQYRFSTKPGAKSLLDRREKAVDMDVGDVCSGGSHSEALRMARICWRLGGIPQEHRRKAAAI